MLFQKLTAPFVLIAVTLAQTFSVNTPAALPQCQPAQILITGGTSPYILAAIPAGQVTAPAISTISSSIAATTYTWIVNLPTGLNITLRLTDAQGNIAYSAARVIQAGASNSCLNASASTSGLTTVSVTTTITSGTVTGATTSAAPTTSTTSTTSVPATNSVSTSLSVSGTSTSISSSASRPASTAWAIPTAIVGLPALALAAAGGVAVLL